MSEVTCKIPCLRAEVAWSHDAMTVMTKAARVVALKAVRGETFVALALGRSSISS